ncbi:MAG: hypothetical protein HY301_14825 [Verrucomicrobia bacterium]|nr:hypothetical protein [Verrucomicrobiota bacterium]
MKLTALPLLAGMFCTLAVRGATLPLYLNNATVNNPQVDAAAFQNNGTFNTTTTAPYDTANTSDYTNSASGLMIGNVGFRLELVTNGLRLPANTIVNRGTMSGATQLLLTAAKITNTGSFTVGAGGLIRIRGDSVSLARAGLAAGGSTAQPIARGTPGGFNLYVNAPGVTDLYWGSGQNNSLDTATVYPAIPLFNPGNGPDFNLPGVNSPNHEVVFAKSQFTNIVQVPSGFGTADYNAFVLQTQTGLNRQYIQVVFVPIDTDPNIVTSVGFFGSGRNGTAIVEFRETDTDVTTGNPVDSTIYLLDRTASVRTNNVLSTNQLAQTYRPNTYEITRSTPFEWTFSSPPNAAYDNDLLDSPNYISNRVTMDYSGYSAQIGGGYSFLAASPINQPSNSPGRIEITGDTLDLSRTRLRAESLLSIRATNLTGFTNYVFDAPFVNFNLVTSNASLVVDNPGPTFVKRLSGQLNVWSAYWTNSMSVGGITNAFEFAVTIVEPILTSGAPVAYGDVYLKGPNIFLGDSFNPQKSFLVDAAAVTIGSNSVLTFPGDLGLQQFPSLRCLTNFGSLTAQNLALFGVQTPPPLDCFVNYGSITGGGIQVLANYFEDGGRMNSGVGPITIGAFTNALVTNGVFQALSANGSIELHGRELLVTNTIFQAGAALVFDVTNSLSDGGVNSSNSWQVGDGFQFLTKPATGSVLGTTLRSAAPIFQARSHLSAGADRGASSAGYTNNVAIGKLILDGGNDSLFYFEGTGVSNAIYVDYLELDNFATNYLTALDFNANLILYFADCNLPAEKLDGSHGGHLRWVSTYAGAFSSTNVALTGGGFITVNRSLRDSSTLDSDADGIPNKYDPFPFDPPFVLVSLAVLPGAAASGGPNSAVITWEAAANTAYRLEYRQGLNGAWTFLQNYTHGPKNGTATVTDPLATNSTRFYRVTYFR